MSDILNDVLKAPWTDEQIAALDARQEDESKHPYTCPNCSHIIEPYRSGWYCSEQCGYSQDWCLKADASPPPNPV